MSDEELIETTAKALYKACWDDLLTFDEDKQQFVEYARAALAVFREHTAPTDEDRETLKQVISDSVGGWNKNTQAITRTADAILASGFRRGAPAEPAVADEMVERAARSIAKSDGQRIDVVPEWMEPYRPIARAALEAALSTERGEK